MNASSILTNKHFVVAMLVAPILAILAYFAADHFSRPEAVVAKAGDQFPLRAKSNCRYESTQCDLVNGEIKFTLNKYFTATGENALKLSSNVPFKMAQIELLDANQSSKEMISIGGSELTEAVEKIASTFESVSSIRIAINADDVIYYSETEAKFLY